MWFYTIYGFFSTSVVGSTVWVRARNNKHLIALTKRFGLTMPIVASPANDYGWRIRVTKKQWSAVVVGLAEEQTWHNFKSEVSRAEITDNAYEHLLHTIWAEGYRYQKQVQRRVGAAVDKQIRMHVVKAAAMSFRLRRGPK